MKHTRDLSNYPFISFPPKGLGYVDNVIELSDGTLVSCSNGMLARWAVNGQLLNPYYGHSLWIHCAMEVDDNTFLTGSLDLTIRVWNKTSGQCLHCIRTPCAVEQLLRLRNNSTFLCGMANGGIEERRLDNYEVIHSLYQCVDSIFSMCELSSGEVVSGTACGKLRVWDMKTRTLVRVLLGHSCSVYRVIELSFKRIASASADTTVRIWEVTTGTCLQILKGHKDKVCGLVVLSDGTLLSGSWDHNIRAWNSEGECVSSCKVEHSISCMIFTRNRSIVTAGRDGEIQVRKTWLSPDTCLRGLCCEAIAKSQPDMIALEQYLPSELCELIVEFRKYLSTA